MDVVLQGDRQAMHEGGPWGDGVGVKDLALVLLGNLDALLLELYAQLFFLSLLQSRRLVLHNCSELFTQWQVFLWPIIATR